MFSAGSFSSFTASLSTDTKGQLVENSSRSHFIPPGVKLVGDNIDKHVKPREMRDDVQAQSPHYFNSYAVKDRLSIAGLEDSIMFRSSDSIDVWVRIWGHC